MVNGNLGKIESKEAENQDVLNKRGWETPKNISKIPTEILGNKKLSI